MITELSPESVMKDTDLLNFIFWKSPENSTYEEIKTIYRYVISFLFRQYIMES